MNDGSRTGRIATGPTKPVSVLVQRHPRLCISQDVENRARWSAHLNRAVPRTLGAAQSLSLHRILAIGAQAVLAPALGDPIVHGHTLSTVLCTNRRMMVDHFLCGRLDSCVLTGVMRTVFFLRVTSGGWRTIACALT